ncbi:CDP-diacylglycerol--glycerol-3-phosphate 3-phosphatidyltransferase [Varunaivibrio sulfuroxidans]|uniref:CDP-diacylglycerol--glycerol-3-phosphate 3-phosphatidyltransferase n=1 Tax=Varunaivibrio sulfuroxidans TaxID=1773489 RepID=A0A4R3J6A4_9PROT|nr:CDP-diacylglycerol--glycerol-3-phosphate 3-phosphatidyltransferase [Varunaivibrio sulfuroxidans]TCS60882.1 CDP-diacylglycerol--glycerol-3-phosphate 3-phosphatidyltransferase [Varunaivibrio sulfuroxidans]WES31709.1 CDP-diacylglycerol--glycerol-3-phosphate 3-phosphatidyltransferase [Varunaivibrio sulfuroxidans]
MPFNLPNILTLTRLLAIPFVVGFMLLGGPWGAWLGLGAYTYACITDFFDGYLARVWCQQSAFGRFLDPIADKLLVAAVLLAAIGIGTIKGVTVLPAAIILCREILVSGLREFLAEAQVGLPVSLLAKWKTTIQMLALGFLIVAGEGPAFGPLSTTRVGEVGLWIAAVITLMTGYDYLRAGLRHMSDKDGAAGNVKKEEKSDL